MTNTPLSALQTHQAIVNGEKSAQDVLADAYKQIQATDDAVGSYISLTQNTAEKVAAAVDAKVKAGEKLPLLAGVPIGLKDNILMLGSKTTCASKILENFESTYDATVTQKLNQHLMPIVGKTNLDEFAMGSSTENSALKVTRNPWDLERVPGGSSGGSASTVAAGQVTLSLGSDTGGSVRQPASFCGIYGLKPTYGLVSRFGLVAFGSSLDQISPFAQNVEDLAALLQITSGFDEHDSTSLDLETPDYLAELQKPLEVKRIGYIEELLGDGVAPAVKQAVEAALKTYEAMGIETVPVSIPAIKYGVAAYYIIAPAEASSNLARFDGIRYGHRDLTQPDLFKLYLNSRQQGFGPEVKRRIMLGTFTLSAGYYDAYYGKAQQVRKVLTKAFSDLFKQVDLLIGPTVPTTAFKIGELVDDPIQMYLSDVATIPVNLAGIPGLNVPCGNDEKGMPIGMQLMGPHLSEAMLLRAALAYEKATGFSYQAPSIKQTATSGV